MNQAIAHITAALANNHIRWPLAIAIALEIIPVWFPHLKSQCQETQKVLLGYSIIAAANTGPAAPTPTINIANAATPAK